MIKTRLLRVLAAAALFVCLTATAFCAGSDGYFCIPRDCEGFPAGARIPVHLFTAD